MKYLVGLGNPGRRYAGTRHNFGWMVLDRVAETKDVVIRKAKRGGRRARTAHLVLFKPDTFMNRSGEAVSQLVADTGADTDDVIVLMDDLDLELGTVRLRPSGSSGGHRGLQSVMDALGTQNIPRLRLGIGPCPPHFPAREYVLQRFREEELPVVNRVIKHAAEAACCWAEEGVELAMSRYNSQVDCLKKD